MALIIRLSEDVESGKAVTTWTLGKAIDLQQVGNAWTEGDDIVSLSLSGDLNIFDKRLGDKPSRVLHVGFIIISLYLHRSQLSQAPPKPITAAVPTSSQGTFMAGLSDGRVLSFSGSEYEYVGGQSHASLVVSMAAASDGKVFSVGYDDQVREISAESTSFVCVARTLSCL